MRNRDLVLGEAMRRKTLLERRHEGRQVTLAFGEGEPAGRQRDAGHRVAAQRCRLGRQTMSGDERVDGGAVLRPDLGDDHVLVGRAAEFAVVDLGDAAQAGEERRPARDVAQPPVLDEQGQVETAVLAFDPAVAVAVGREGERPRVL
jgi:hypothetical protein